MQDQLDQISDAEKALFKNAVAGAIYLELKSHPRRFGELESTIGCSPNSLDKNLNKGRKVGVWEKCGKYYRLTENGDDLPEIISVHAKLQQDHELVYKGTTYKHMNVEGGSSTVIDRVSTDSDGFTFTEKYSEVIGSMTEQLDSKEDLLEWFNPALSNKTQN